MRKRERYKREEADGRRAGETCGREENGGGSTVGSSFFHSKKEKTRINKSWSYQMFVVYLRRKRPRQIFPGPPLRRSCTFPPVSRSGFKESRQMQNMDE